MAPARFLPVQTSAPLADPVAERARRNHHEAIRELQLRMLSLISSVEAGGGGGSDPLFTASTQGEVPASGGGTTTFLRADGSWAAPGGATLADGDYGDIIVGGGGTTMNVDTDSVGNTKLANMADSTIKGRAAGAGAGDPTDLSSTQATAILDVFTSALKGLTPASGGGTANYLRADGTWAAPTAAVNVTAATLALGATAKTEHRIAVVDGLVSGTSKIQVAWGNTLDTDPNGPDMDSVTFAARAGSGTFDVLVCSLSPILGDLKIHYLVG